MQAFLALYRVSGVCKLEEKQTVLWPINECTVSPRNVYRNVMISFIWSLRAQRLGTTVKHKSLFPWGSIAVAVPTGLLSTLDGNNIILTPWSLDHRGKNPPPPPPQYAVKRMNFGPHIRSGRKEKFSVIIRNGKVTFWQDYLYAERRTEFIYRTRVKNNIFWERGHPVVYIKFV